MDFTDICKSILFSLFFGILFIVSLYVIGIIDGRVLQATNPLTGEIVSRNALGFRHQNYLGKLALAAFAAYWYLRLDKLTIYDIAIVIAGLLVLYFIVNTKTVSALILFALPITFLLKNSKKKQWRYIILAIFIVLQLAEIFAVYTFDPTNSFYRSIDSLMSTRLSAANAMIQKYIVTPFGQEVEIISSIDALNAGISSATLDICFFNILLNNGVIILLLVIIAWSFLVKISINQSTPALFIIVILILFSGLLENWCVSLPACFMLTALVTNLQQPNHS